jgi:hypothetical protein
MALCAVVRDHESFTRRDDGSAATPRGSAWGPLARHSRLRPSRVDRITPSPVARSEGPSRRSRRPGLLAPLVQAETSRAARSLTPLGASRHCSDTADAATACRRQRGPVTQTLLGCPPTTVGRYRLSIQLGLRPLNISPVKTSVASTFKCISTSACVGLLEHPARFILVDTHLPV